MFKELTKFINKIFPRFAPILEKKYKKVTLKKSKELFEDTIYEMFGTKIDYSKRIPKEDSVTSLILHSVNLESFTISLKGLKEKLKGNIWENFTENFFLFNRNLYNVKNYYRGKENTPKYILEELGLEEKDNGIDDIIEHNCIHNDNNDDNEECKCPKYSIVQDKFRSKINQSLKRDSIVNMTFESLYANKKGMIKDHIVFSNVISKPNNMTIIEEKHIKFVLYSEIIKMDWYKFQEFVYKKNVEKVDIDKIKNYIPKLFDHQQEAYNYTLNKDRSTVIIACGGGKTLFSYRCLKDISKGLIVVPTLYLLAQTYRYFSKFDDGYKYLLIGSDCPNDGNVEDDEGIESTTNEEVIKKFLGENKKYIIISTYQSLYKLVNSLGEADEKLEMSIFDEAHMTCTGKESKYSLATGDFPSKKKIFMTATPKIYTGKNEDIISMNSVEIYGESKNFLSISD